MIFPVVLSGKMIFFSPKNKILFFRLKKKDYLSQKILGNITFSLNTPKRWSFQIKSRWNMIFHVLFGKMVFFSGKCDIFLGGK